MTIQEFQACNYRYYTLQSKCRYYISSIIDQRYQGLNFFLNFATRAVSVKRHFSCFTTEIQMWWYTLKCTENKRIYLRIHTYINILSDTYSGKI